MSDHTYEARLQAAAEALEVAWKGTSTLELIAAGYVNDAKIALDAANVPALIASEASLRAALDTIANMTSNGNLVPRADIHATAAAALSPTPIEES